MINCCAGILKKLVITGMHSRYGERPDKEVTRRISWEVAHIIDAGFEDYYLLAYKIFNQYARSSGIGVWGVGATPSSIVCYCLGLTEVDPVRFGLHSARFVNENPPVFQFDIEKSRYVEFVQNAEEIILNSDEGLDRSSLRESLLKHLCQMDYLSHKRGQEIPLDIEDEMAQYALLFPDTKQMYDTYMRCRNGESWCSVEPYDQILGRTYDLLVYQEQMFDILHLIFKVDGIDANRIRRSIQRRNAEQMECWKAYLKSLSEDFLSNQDSLGWVDAELGWQVLTDNPKAFLKAHAASRIIARQRYETHNEKG